MVLAHGGFVLIGLMDGELRSLLARTANADRTAFGELYDRTASRLFGVVSRILPRRELAEDALQEAFLRIWQKAATYDSAIASPMAWLATIARNQAIDHRRRFAERLSASADEVDANVPDLAPRPDVLAEQSNDMKRLKECLGNLPADRQEMVLLAYYQGYSRDELSTRYDRPVTTIKTLLRRSLIALKECLDGR